MSTTGIRNAIDEARPLPRATREIDPEPDQGRVVNGIETRAGDWKPDMLGLPPDCPVKPLGIDGKVELAEMAALPPFAQVLADHDADPSTTTSVEKCHRSATRTSAVRWPFAASVRSEATRSARSVA